jgi:pimeloyl-ACP methyl ester carboxylesterase
VDFVGIAVLALGGATLLLALLFAGLRAACGKARRGWLRRALLIGLGSLPVHALVTVPAVLGYLGSRRVATRSEERDYAGPRIGADGSWILQSRASLRAEREGHGGVDPELRAAAAATAVTLTSADGTRLRAFVVPPAEAAPRATAVLVHGLFRGALEIERVGAMFRDLGCEVVLLELRNHGGSGRAPATFGLDEADDVLAAVGWARSRGPEAAARPLILFGVSLGTAAVGLAAPRVERLGGVVVDAPLSDALATAHRMLGGGADPRPRRIALPQPLRSLALTALEWWSGIDLAADRPGEALQQVGEEVPILVIGGADDRRMPPAEVRALFEALPQRLGVKELWICEAADHGDVWEVDPDGYRLRLGAFVERVLRR